MPTEWRRRLRRAGVAVAAASATSDAAFAHLDETIRAARRAGRTVADLVTVTGLSKARVDEAVAGAADDGQDAAATPPPAAPLHADADLRIAAYTAAAAVADFLAARARRDALMLQAGLASGLRFAEIAAAAGTSRRYEWQLRTGRLSTDRRSPRQDVFEGAGIEAYRATENATLRARRQAAKAGANVTRAHGLQGYRLGCRCDICVAAHRGVQEGSLEVRHGLTGYRDGCRCEVCREGHAAYHRDWRRRRHAAIPTETEE